MYYPRGKSNVINKSTLIGTNAVMFLGEITREIWLREGYDLRVQLDFSGKVRPRILVRLGHPI